jgi:cell division protein FtsQ
MTTTPTSTPTPTPTPPPVRINPRIRERRIEVQREAGRRRLRVLLVVTSVLSAAGLAFLTITSPLLDVDAIRVAGARHVTAAQVRAASGVHLHDHLLFADTGAIARRLERLAWVDHASVSTDLPGTVEIRVTEYAPVAYVRMRRGVMLVAANGHVIAPARRAPARTVEVRGIRRVPAAGALLSPPDAAGIVTRLPRALASRVVAVDVSGAGPVLDLTGGGEIRLGDTSDLGAKAASAQAVLAQIGAGRFEYIDVSTPDRPVSHP